MGLAAYYRAGVAMSEPLHDPALTHYRRGVEVGRFLGMETAGDVELTLDKLNSDILVFSKEIDTAVAPEGKPLDQTTPLYGFYRDVWSPFIREWQSFYSKNHTWFANFMRDLRHHRDGYLEQFQEIRSKAKSLGMDVQSPEPTVPKPDTLDQLLSFAKVVLWIIVGVGVIIIVRQFL